MQSHSSDDPGTARLRNFLLGALPAEETERMEERLLIDPQMFESIEAIEADLFDAFVANTLSPAERAAFMVRYSPEQHRLNFARALAKRAEPQSNVAPIARHRPYQIWAAAAAVLIVVAAAFVLFTQQQRSLPATIASTKHSRSPRTPKTSTEPTALRTVALTLALTAMRDGNDVPHVTIPRSADAVAMKIRLNPADRFPEYGVIIRRADESAAWSDEHAHASSSSGEDLIVTTQVPSPSLPAGEYRLAVSGKRADATTELLGDVRFAVATPPSSPHP
jgi:anti-sigma-K factor RskA